MKRTARHFSIIAPMVELPVTADYEHVRNVTSRMLRCIQHQLYCISFPPSSGCLQSPRRTRRRGLGTEMAAARPIIPAHINMSSTCGALGTTPRVISGLLRHNALACDRALGVVRELSGQPAATAWLRSRFRERISFPDDPVLWQDQTVGLERIIRISTAC